MKPEFNGIIEVESEYRQTEIVCPSCKSWYLYTDGTKLPQCVDDNCGYAMSLPELMEWLITAQEHRQKLAFCPSCTWRLDEVGFELVNGICGQCGTNWSNNGN